MIRFLARLLASKRSHPSGESQAQSNTARNPGFPDEARACLQHHLDEFLQGPADERKWLARRYLALPVYRTIGYDLFISLQGDILAWDIQSDHLVKEVLPEWRMFAWIRGARLCPSLSVMLPQRIDEPDCPACHGTGHLQIGDHAYSCGTCWELGWVSPPAAASEGFALVEPHRLGGLGILLTRWRHTDAGPRLPKPKDAIQAAFSQAGVRLTADVLELYSILDGMDEMDNAYWRLWSLDEIIADSRENDGPGIVFSDYMTNSWYYRLVANEDDTSAIYLDRGDRGECVLIARTLATFFEAYLADPDALLIQV